MYLPLSVNTYSRFVVGNVGKFETSLQEKSCMNSVFHICIVVPNGADKNV